MDRKTISDDALISTDIDNIIKYLAIRQRVAISAMARDLGMKPDILKKWLAVLEDEGYLKIEYKLLNEYVVWAGEPHPVIQESAPEQKMSEEFFTQPILPKKEEEKKPAGEEYKPHERIERIMEKIGTKEEKSEEEIAKNMISSFKEEKKEEAPKPSEEKDEAFAVLPSKKAEHRIEKPIHRIREEEKEEEGEFISLRKSLSEYMDEIKVQKQGIEKLNSEKERLLAESYLPLEQRFKSAYDSIVERLLEKEEKIMELKGRMLELSGKIGDIEKVEIALRKIREEGRRTVSANKGEMERLRKSLAAEDALLKDEMEDMEKETKARKAELVDIEHSVSQIDAKEQEIKKETEGLNKQLSEINEAIASSYASISNLSQTRAELARRMENIKTSLDSRSNEISASYARLQDIKTAEAAIDEYLSDYAKKMEGIEEYAKQSEKELAKLGEFAEVKYMRGYLKELESLSSNYETELEAVGAQEKGVEERIADAKSRLNELLKESRSLVKALEKKTSGKDFDTLASQMRGKHAAVLSTVREKSGEMLRLGEEAPPSIRAKEIPAKKQKKKETKKKRK